MRPQIILGALAACLALGVTFYLVRDQGPATTQQDNPTEARRNKSRGKANASDRVSARGNQAEDEGDGDLDLEQRVARLERELATLRRQVALPRGGRPTALDSAAPDEVGGGVVDNPELDSTVRDILADERQRENEARWERRTTRAMERLTEAAGLNEEQQTGIAALWDSERDRISPLFSEARNGDRDFDQVIKDVDAIREETDAEAKKLLSGPQLEAYGEHRPQGPGGPGRGGGGGRGPGGADRRGG